MGSLHKRGENGMGQTEAHCGQSSQPVTQAEASLECLCNAALSAGARVRPPGGRWGTDRGHNMYPIYNLLPPKYVSNLI